MTLDASDEKLVHISLRVLNEIGRRLFGGNGDQGHSFVGRFEPYNLRALDRCSPRLVPTVALTLTALGFLLLFGRSRRWAQQTKCTGEKLTRHPFYNGYNMASELRLDIVGNPVARGKHNTRTDTKGGITLHLQTAKDLVLQPRHRPSSCRPYGRHST